MQTNQNHFVMTPREAAEFLRIDGGNWQNTLRYYQARGKLRPTRIGRRVFYTEQELKRFVISQTQ